MESFTLNEFAISLCAIVGLCVFCIGILAPLPVVVCE
jgi:hypothetical protein